MYYARNKFYTAYGTEVPFAIVQDFVNAFIDDIGLYKYINLSTGFAQKNDDTEAHIVISDVDKVAGVAYFYDQTGSTDGLTVGSEAIEGQSVTLSNITDYVKNGDNWVEYSDVPDGMVIDGNGGFMATPKPVDPTLKATVAVSELLESPTLVAEMPKLQGLKVLQDYDRETLEHWLNTLNTADAKLLDGGDGSLKMLGVFSAKKEALKVITNADKFASADKKSNASLSAAIVRVREKHGAFELTV